MSDNTTCLIPPAADERKLLEDSVELVFRQMKGEPVHENAPDLVFRRLQEVRGETRRTA